MQEKKRYPLLNVLWVVLIVNMVFSLFGLIVLFMLGSAEGKSEIQEFFTVTNLLKKILGLACQVLFYYDSLNYYNKLMVEKKASAYYIRYSAFTMVFLFTFFLGTFYLFPQIGTMDGKKSPTSLLILSAVLSGVFYTALSLLVAYFNNLRDDKKQRKILEAQKMQLELDKAQANFKFLKSQINPHFLHNTLNFFYAKSLPYSVELSEGILTLADIMRYALHEAVDIDDKAPLKDEIEHVRNVIKINQLRFSNNLHVNFEVKGVINGAEIIPFLLITVVENAFKHGDLQRVEYPINIKLVIEHNKLYFYCHNKKKSGPKEISTGLGLDNIRNRLDYAYGKTYRLLIKDEAEFYTTELTIDKL